MQQPIPELYWPRCLSKDSGSIICSIFHTSHSQTSSTVVVTDGKHELIWIVHICFFVLENSTRYMEMISVPIWIRSQLYAVSGTTSTTFITLCIFRGCGPPHGHVVRGNSRVSQELDLQRKGRQRVEFWSEMTKFTYRYFDIVWTREKLERQVILTSQAPLGL